MTIPLAVARDYDNNAVWGAHDRSGHGQSVRNIDAEQIEPPPVRSPKLVQGVGFAFFPQMRERYPTPTGRSLVALSFVLMAIMVAIWREWIREAELSEEHAQQEPELQLHIRDASEK